MIAAYTPTQIMEQPSGGTRRFACLSPRSLEVVFQGIAVPIEHESTAERPTTPPALDEIT
jgi:hypothetical protein